MEAKLIEDKMELTDIDNDDEIISKYNEISLMIKE